MPFAERQRTLSTSMPLVLFGQDATHGNDQLATSQLGS